MNNQDSARVRAWLEQGVLLFDGATGTALRAQAEEGEAVERLCDPATARFGTAPGLSGGGLRAIKTNTFAAHVSMACENEEDQRGLILAACRLAQRASEGYNAFVFADIGPAPVEAQNASACYIGMADLFLSAGLTCFLFETMPGDKGLAEAAEHIKTRCPEAFVMVSFAADADGFTRSGEPGRRAGASYEPVRRGGCHRFELHLRRISYSPPVGDAGCWG